MEIKKRQFTKDYLELTTIEMAAKYNVSRPTIVAVARSFGILRNPGRPKKIRIIK